MKEITKDAAAVGAGVILGEALVYAASIHAHREMSHGSIRLRPALREVFRFGLLFGSGIDSRQYAAVHDYHHDPEITDTPNDPHSPQHKGKLAVLFGTAVLNRQARKQIPEILKRTETFKRRGSENDPAFQRNADGELEIKPHSFDVLLNNGGLAYTFGLGVAMTGRWEPNAAP